MALSLYLHFPFCRNLCGYCDFYKEKYDRKTVDDYLTALEIEIALAAGTVDADRRRVETIYIGGGTPSLLSPEQLGSIITAARNHFTLADDLEFTLEINPETIDGDRLDAYRELGVNRPVFGVQSFDLGALRLLSRRHRLDETYRTVYLARALGFDNFGIDMIFGLPRQTAGKLAADLAQVAELTPPHISYYQLTVEPGTPLERRVADSRLKLPGTDLCAAMYRGINAELKRFNYFRYEISSYAQPGYECRHNLRYWEGGDFLGLGPSAHSYLGDRRFANMASLDEYLKAINNRQRPLVFDNAGDQSRLTEAIMLGLRTSRGIDRRGFRHRFGQALEKVIDRDSYELLLKSGHIDDSEEYLRLTEAGLPLADEIIRRLMK